MISQWILTPFFLDAPEPRLRQLAIADREWHVTSVTLPTEDPAVPASAAARQLARMSAIHRPLAAHVQRIAEQGERPISVAGDCCAVIPVLAGLQRAGVDPIVVWLDAHGDFNTHDTTLSGFIGGMPLAMITGRGQQSLLQATGLRPLPDEDVMLADARDLDAPERELLDRSAVVRFDDVRTLVDHLPDRPIYVHLDVDIIDADEAPAMAYPVKGGPDAETLRTQLARLRETHRLVGASMTPWALDRDKDGRTAEACWSVFHALVGPA
jgi:arginase